MPTTNLYFNNYSFTGEQRLIEDLIIEAIKIYGVECYYLPRTLVNEDEVWGEDASSKFESAYPLEMYIKNVDSFEGEGDFLSKFGLEIRDSVTLTISQRRFGEEIDWEDSTEDAGRPVEGDLIWFPLNGKIFEVKHVEHEAIFYQLGSLQTYDLRCELFEYSSQIIDTGVKVIDDIGTKFSIDELIYQILFETYTDTAFASSTISGGQVTDVTITHPGENFATAPTVTFESPQGEPTRATGTAVVANGQITSITITDGGGYYSTAPTVTFGAPLDESKSAEALAVLDRNTVKSVAVTDSGYYYHEAPAVTIGAPDAQYVLGGTLANTGGIMGERSLYYPDQNHFFTINSFGNEEQVTLDFFIKPVANNTSGTLFQTQHCRFSMNNGIIEFNDVVGSTPITSDEWTYVFLHCNTSVYTIYVDGNEEMQVPKTQNLANGFVTFGDAVGNTFVGYYDALRFRNGQIMNIATPTTVATNAEATSTISDGKVVSISVTNEGGYYTTVPQVTVADPVGESINATATSTLSGLSVDSTVQITNGGFYYTEAPEVTFSVPEVYSNTLVKFGNTSLHLSNTSTTYRFENLTPQETGTINLFVGPDIGLATNGDILSTDDWKLSKHIDASDPENIKFVYCLHYANNSHAVENKLWNYTGEDEDGFDFIAVQVKESLGNKILKVRVNDYSNSISSATTDLPLSFALHGTTITLGGSTALANTFIDAVTISDYVADDAQAIPTEMPTVGVYAPWGGANIVYANTFEDHTTATGTATINNGTVTGITVDYAGYGYQEAPIITIASPNTATYYAASANAVVANGHVVDITISNNGIGYYTAPDVTIESAIYNEFEARVTYHGNNILFAEDFEHKQAYANAVVNANGIVTSVVVTDRGFGYELPPTITFTAPDTDQYYRAEGNTEISNGQVTTINITNTGFGYTQSNAFPVVALPVYNTAEGYANVNANGIVTSITITDPGQGYTNVPKVFITGEPISGALQSEDGAFFLHEESNTVNRQSADNYADNEVFQQEVETVDTETNIGFIDFSERNPFSEGGEW